MILVHLDFNPSKGEVLVRLPDGTKKWVTIAELKALAESDKSATEETVGEAKPTRKTGKK